MNLVIFRPTRRGSRRNPHINQADRQLLSITIGAAYAQAVTTGDDALRGRALLAFARLRGFRGAM